MAIKDQFKTLKDNWLLILIVLVVLAVISIGGNSFTALDAVGGYAKGGYGYAEETMMDMAYAAPSMARGYIPSYGNDFAPEVEERKITKTARISTEVERGTFHQAQVQLKNILDASDAYILNENVNKYDTDTREYYIGHYNLKIESSKYGSVVAQLKEIGDIQEFNEDADDVTSTYTDIEIELEAERERLERYQEMYDEAENVEEKLQLTDRIFNQERTIKYYEDRLENMDARVDYSTISFTMTEEQSEYLDIVFVKFSELVRAIVNSINNVFTWLFVLLPYAVAAGLIWLVVKLVKRRKKRR